MVIKEQDAAVKRPFYKNIWFRVIALVLVASMIFSLWASSAIQIKIMAQNERDAAAQYLIDNTEYIQQDDLERLGDKLESYSRANELADFYQLAGTQIAAGEYGEALASIDKCLELYGGDDRTLYLDLLLKRGCLLVLLGEYPTAVEALEKVLLEDPTQADAYLVLAQIHAETGNLEGLVPVLTEYLKLRSDDSDMRAVLAQTLFELGEYERAVEEYDRLLEAEEPANEAEIRFLKGLTLIQLGDYGEAGEILQQLADSGAELANLRYYLAVCYLSREDYDKAAEYFTLSIDGGEMYQLSSYSRGICRLMGSSPDYDGALQDLENTVSYDGEDSDASVVEQAESLLETLLAAQTGG